MARGAKAAGMAALVALAVSVAAAATPQQEEAFLKAWSVHARDPQDHKAVIAACQGVMDRASTLGEFLPVVRTLAAWHLLADGKRADAVRTYESAVAKERAATPMGRFGDIMARRWLTRLDIQQVEKALSGYYAEHVSFPGSLAPLYSLPKGSAPVRTDRFGDAWVYEPKGFSKLTGTANQKYALHSKSMGNRLSQLKAVSLTAYSPVKRARLLGRKTASPLTVEFEVTSELGTQRSVLAENGIANGVRFLMMSSDGRFAIMVDSESDYWIVATAARGQ